MGVEVYCREIKLKTRWQALEIDMIENCMANDPNRFACGFGWDAHRVEVKCAKANKSISYQHSNGQQWVIDILFYREKNIYP